MQHPIPPDLGPRTYAAYGQAVGGLTHDGQPLPAWDDLGDEIQAGWTAAARAAVAATLTGGTR